MRTFLSLYKRAMWAQNLRNFFVRGSILKIQRDLESAQNFTYGSLH